MPFEFVPTEIPDVVEIHPPRHHDARGWFSEVWRASEFEAAGITGPFVQNNLAWSRPGVLRGLHYQLPPAPQGKLVRAARGTIFDVALDLRTGSETFGRWVGRRLDDREGTMLWIPPGFAHGYQVLDEDALVLYQVTAEWVGDLDRGIRWNDPDVGVRWPREDPVLSDKDRALPRLEEVGEDDLFPA